MSGVLFDKEDEVVCLLLGWFMALAGVFGALIGWPDLVILALSLFSAGTGVWLLVTAFLHYRAQSLKEFVSFHWELVKTEVQRDR